MSLPVYHIHHDTARGRKPFTYFVFGPYENNGPTGQEFDVEVYHGHLVEEARDGEFYVGTATISRNTHVVADMWNWMDANV